METFSQITDTGRGRLLFTSHRLGEEGRLYLTTTGDFVLSHKNRESILGNQEEAIGWQFKTAFAKASGNSLLNALRWFVSLSDLSSQKFDYCSKKML